MVAAKHLEDRIFGCTSDRFEELAMDIFQFQVKHNPVYARFLSYLKKDTDAIRHIEDIPFLPISLFKTQRVLCTGVEASHIFESSGTTGNTTSRHYVASIDLYKRSFLSTFEMFYGNVTDWCILALLPSYLERNNSSLIYMVQELIKISAKNKSGFYLDQYTQLSEQIRENETAEKKTMLFGVTYALLDFAEQFPASLKNTIVVETGGMKGRKKEIIRDEVHAILKQRLGVTEIHSEYGMTELLSQAYAVDKGIFHCPPWMKVRARAEDDPLLLLPQKAGTSGAANVIDLANLYSCSFLATDDLVRFRESGFEILGRIDNSDIRGCSLLLKN